MRLDSFNAAAATELLSGMSRDIRAWVEPAAAGEPVVERRVAFMRYVGQGHEIAVELPVRDLLATDTAALRARYEADYEKMFRRSIPAAALEIMALSVNVSTVSQLLEQIADVDQYPLSMVGESIRTFRRPGGQADRRVALPSRQAVGRPVRAGDHRRRGDVNLRHREFRRLDRWSGFHRDGTQGNNSVNKPGLTLIDKQVMWSYLIAVVEEQAQTLQRTAFSTVVRESGDLAAGVFDADGRMLAQGDDRPRPAISIRRRCVGHVIDHYPIPTMQSGDVLHPQRSQRSGKPVSMSPTAAASILRQKSGCFQISWYKN